MEIKSHIPLPIPSPRPCAPVSLPQPLRALTSWFCLHHDSKALRVRVLPVVARTRALLDEGESRAEDSTLLLPPLPSDEGTAACVAVMVETPPDAENMSRSHSLVETASKPKGGWGVGK